MDIARLPHVDLVADLDQALPFPDECFLEVSCLDVLEHVSDLTNSLREIHRVTRPGGSVIVRGPHFSSRAVYEDPTHRRGFTCRTFDFYCSASDYRDRSYYFDFHFDSVASVSVHLPAILKKAKVPLERAINRSRRAQDCYELTALARLCPATNVSFRLMR